MLREDSGAVGRAGPTAADGYVKNDKEGVIEGPRAAGGPLGLCERGVQIRIDVEANCPGFPLDSVEMKIGGDILAHRQAERRGSFALSRNFDSTASFSLPVGQDVAADF